MKKKIFTVVATVGILFGLAVMAGAQQRNLVQAKIRFSFLAGEKRMKPGDYTIKRMSQNTFVMRSDDTKDSVVLFAPVSLRQQPEGSPERLVFKRFGSEYVLVEVWSDREGDGRALNSKKIEQRLAEQFKSAPQTIEVLAKGN